MSLLHGVADVLQTASEQLGGETITLRRGTDSTDGLVAVPLKTKQVDYGPEEVHISARDQDWRIDAEKYAFADKAVEPAAGDEIDWTVGDVKRTFVVCTRGEDERCYRHTDQTRRTYRVFTAEKPTNPE